MIGHRQMGWPISPSSDNQSDYLHATTRYIHIKPFDINKLKN